VLSTDGPGVTTLDGQPLWFTAPANPSTIDGIRFTGALNGAVVAESAQLTVRNCLFDNNESGALTASSGAEVFVENSRFDSNTGIANGKTGGILATGLQTSLNVVSSEFTNNSSPVLSIFPDCADFGPFMHFREGRCEPQHYSQPLCRQ
jgi:hypothetical protein